MMDEAQFMEWNVQVFGKMQGYVRPTAKKLTDSQPWELIQRSSGHENAVQFRCLEGERLDAVLGKVLKEDVLIRQASRVTGIGTGVIEGTQN